uniref:Uncharacterized protein n=1 Tax=Arcella intermedia TaxID=1963864 RepID=A0A6B2LK55_9EUKA
MDNLRIVLMGSGGVGKSTLYVRYTQDIFVEKYDPVYEGDYRKCFEMDTYQYPLEISELHTSLEDMAYRDYYIKSANGFVIVYSTIDKPSFVTLSDIHSTILRVRRENSCEDPPIIMAGNKVDLVEERTITTESGEQLAFELGCVFLETSAKTSINVKELFETCAKLIIRKRNSVNTNKNGRGGGCSLI